MPVKFIKPDWATSSDAYEIMEPLIDETGTTVGSDDRVELHAAFTPGNGIRLHIIEYEDGDETSSEFDLDLEDAIALGEALIRWGQAGH